MARQRLNLIVWAAPLVLLAPVLIGVQRIYYGTVSLQFIPWRWHAWLVLAGGEIPALESAVRDGGSAPGQLPICAVVSPELDLLTASGLGGLSALAWAQGVLAAAHLLLACAGMARLLKALGLGILAQGVGGLAFGVSGYLVARSHFLSINAAVAWLPWLLLAVYRVVIESGQERRRAAAALTLVVALLLLAGHAQTAWYSLLLAGGWAIFWLGNSFAHSQGGPRKGKWNAVLWLALAVVIGAALAAAQLLPTAELLGESARSGGADESFAMTYSFWPWRLLGLALPGLFGSPVTGDFWGYANYWEDAVYIGLLPLFLALGTIKSQSDHPVYRPLSRFLFILTGVSFLLAFGKNTPIFPFLYRFIPTFDLFQAPARFSIWAVFSLSVLAGLGAQSWASTQSVYSRSIAGRWLAAALGLALAGAATLITLRQISPSIGRAALIAGLIGSAAAGLGLARRRETKWRAGVLVLIALDLLVAGWGLDPGIDRGFYSSESPNAAALRQQLAGGRLYLFEPDEYALTFDRYFRFDDFNVDTSGLRASLLPNLNLLDGLTSANNFDPLLPARYARWIAELESAQPETQAWMLSQMNVSVVERYLPGDEPFRFQVESAEPRVEWLPCAWAASDPESALAAVFENPEDLEFAIIVETEGSPIEQVCDPSLHGTAEIMDSTSNSITVHTAATESGWLLVRDMVYPGWSAQVDGSPAEIYAANSIFRAFRVAAGEHEIRMEYSPASFFLGVAISVLTLLGLVVFWTLKLRMPE